MSDRGAHSSAGPCLTSANAGGNCITTRPCTRNHARGGLAFGRSPDGDKRLHLVEVILGKGPAFGLQPGIRPARFGPGRPRRAAATHPAQRWSHQKNSRVFYNLLLPRLARSTPDLYVAVGSAGNKCGSHGGSWQQWGPKAPQQQLPARPPLLHSTRLHSKLTRTTETSASANMLSTRVPRLTISGPPSRWPSPSLTT